MRNLFRLFLIIAFLVLVKNAHGQNKIALPESLKNSRLGDKITEYIEKADILRDEKEYKQAEKLYRNAYKSSWGAADSIRYQTGFKYIYFLKLTLKDYKRAWDVNESLYEYFSGSEYLEGIIQCTIEYGVLSTMMGRPSKALFYYNEALELLENKGKEYNEYKFRVLNNRAILMEREFSGEDKENIQELVLQDRKEALSYLTKSNSYDQWTRAYLNLSQSFRKKNIDSTIYYNRQALKFAEKTSTPQHFYTLLYNNIADAYLIKNQPDKSLEALNNIDFIGSKEEVNGYAFATLGEVYIALKRYKDALKSLKVAEKKLIEVKDWAASKYVVELLSDVFQKTGNQDAAIKELKKIPSFLQSSYNARLDREITKLKIQLKLEEKEKEVVTLQEEKETITLQMNKVQMISYILGILLLIGVFIYVNRISVNKAKFYKLNEKVNHNRLLSLQSAMNPHFLFNTFGTLQHFILKKEIKKANSYMTTLSDLIRNVFASSNSIYILFNSEIDILKSYIELELDRFDHSFEVSFEIPQELTDNNPMIPSMILQPYVENAIIHGFSEKKGTKKLTLKFELTNSKCLQCEITDNGIGRKKVEEIQKKSKPKTKKNLSIATKNTEERLNIINKKNEQEGNIVIHDLYDTEGNAAGTQVVISLPIIKNNTN